MSLAELTWLKSIVTTVVIAAYGVLCCLVIGSYFARQQEAQEPREPRPDRTASATGEPT